MSNTTGMIIYILNEARILQRNVKEQILPKKALTELKLSQESLDDAYMVLDRLMMLNGDVNIGSAIAQVQARIELAEDIIIPDQHDERTTTHL